MSRAAIVILVLGVLLLFLSILFPPWVIYTKGQGGGTELPYGYTFLFTTPEPEGEAVSIRVDFLTLFLEWAAIVACTAGALFIERRRSGSRQEEETPKEPEFWP